MTLEALLPAAPGKQRWTDQTFVVTGPRARRLVALLQGAQVYAGPVPAGCQPWGRSTTITVQSAGRRLLFRSYCDLIWAGNGVEILTSAALVTAVDATEASLEPTRTVSPPRDAHLVLGPLTVYDRKTKQDREVAGTLRVTQDGKVLATKRVGTGGRLGLHVAPGHYDIAGSSPGLLCKPTDIVVTAGSRSGGIPYCT